MDPRTIGRAVPDPIALVALYVKAHGRLPKLWRPEAFTEKVLWRVLFDRRPVLAEVSDKARARRFIAARLGEHVLPHLYFATTDPRALPFDSLPNRFVLKPTHASGWVLLVPDKRLANPLALVRRCQDWMGASYARTSREWLYRDVVRLVHAEEFISDGGPGAPNDYKLFVFDGRVHMVQVDVDRFGLHARAFLTPDWVLTEARLGPQPRLGTTPPRPVHLDAMIAAAEQLGRDFDFLRVDCFCSREQFYINELTATPCRGLNAFAPVDFDRALGAQWRLEQTVRSAALTARRWLP